MGEISTLGKLSKYLNKYYIFFTFNLMSLDDTIANQAGLHLHCTMHYIFCTFTY